MNIFNIFTSPIRKIIYLLLFQLSNCNFFLLANKYLLTYLLNYGKGWHYLSRMSKHDGNFYYLNSLRSIGTKKQT